MSPTDELLPSCPIPISEYPAIMMAHGGGGRLMHQLIEKMLLPVFGEPNAPAPHDSAVLPALTGRLAFTTDSYVVQPLFFPGGDIGELAVNGTVNDLAMSGARPLYLSAGFVLEEGLPMQTLWRIVHSMRRAADRAGVRIVTGDTKVVDHGKGDGIFINTAGIGVVDHDLDIGPASIRPGDAILVNGDLGRHGIAIMALREGLQFESAIASDTAPLNGPVAALIAAGVKVHCLRDLTRGGLASALNELAEGARATVAIEERSIPVRADVRGACEMLGFDPLYVANEGRMVVFVDGADGERALEVLRSQAACDQAALIGRVTDEPGPMVAMKSIIGTRRIVDMMSGEQLPRIC